ncbi:MAG TPA: formate dehydrogenase accessory sulfurtransferase FdhD [Acidimicrobiia bacterium]|jgi:FdhD protein|nr:formate dehydrogenase accessory sulfurtransferase FdhD [Acidimicrobiia bacterium]
MSEPATAVEVIRLETGHPPTTVVDRVAVEEPIEIRLNGTPLAVLMRTPGQEADLLLGFAITEGIVLSPNEVSSVEDLGDGDRYRLVLADGVTVDPEQFRRNAYTTSSCGVCGKASIDAVRVAARPLPPGPRLTVAELLALPQQLAQAQPTFAATGGLHAAAIFTSGGELLSAAEDVGRHNATDKAIGALARKIWPLGEVILMVSGRISFEITQKAAVAGIPVVAGVSAASSLAVNLAREMGMTLAGFVRDRGLVLYAGRERLAEELGKPAQ